MRNYLGFGNDLYMEYERAAPYGIPDLTMAQMHNCPELLLVLDRVPYSTVVNGKTIKGVGPMATLVAPYCMHFTYYTDKSITGKFYSAYYIGNGYSEKLGEEAVPLKRVFGDSHAVVYNLEGYEDALKKIEAPILDIHRSKPRISGHYYKSTDVKQQLLFGVIINMLYDLRNERIVETFTGNESYIYDVVMYIVNNLDQNLNTPKIAENFFVSRDKLNRDFRQYTKMTIKEFVTSARINLAKSKLVEKKYSISEISDMCGFESEIYFYSFFKKNTGMTPREYALKITV